MTVALVMTVRDEQEFLRANLLYHHYLGVDLAYVYDDGSTDATVESVRDLPFVRIGRSVPAEDFRDRADLAPFVEAAATLVTARQALNTVHAMAQARAAGATWLLAIDADELVALDLVEPRRGHLRDELEGQRAATAAVVFRTLEVVQRRFSYTDVLAEETLFKRPEAGIDRPAYDPFARRQRTVRAIYGHRKGKSAVRLSVDTLPKTPHRFVGRDDAPLPTVTTGYLLHYYAHSFDAFVHKFRRFHDHPDTHQWGNPLKPQKQLLRDVVNRAGLSDDELRDYYRRWVMFDEQEIRRLSRRRRMGVIPQQPAIVEVTSVRRALEQIRAAADAVAGATSGNDAAGSR